jgi:hypothetical protein
VHWLHDLLQLSAPSGELSPPPPLLLLLLLLLLASAAVVCELMVVDDCFSCVHQAVCDAQPTLPDRKRPWVLILSVLHCAVHSA